MRMHLGKEVPVDALGELHPELLRQGRIAENRLVLGWDICKFRDIDIDR